MPLADVWGICSLLYHPSSSFCIVRPGSPIAMTEWIRGEHVIQAEPMSFSFLGIWTGIESMDLLPEGSMSTCDRLLRRGSFGLSLAPEHQGWLLPHPTFLGRPGRGQRLVNDQLTQADGGGWKWASDRLLLCRAGQWVSPGHTHHGSPSALEPPTESCRPSANFCWVNKHPSEYMVGV